MGEVQLLRPRPDTQLQVYSPNWVDRLFFVIKQGIWTLLKVGWDFLLLGIGAKLVQSKQPTTDLQRVISGAGIANASGMFQQPQQQQQQYGSYGGYGYPTPPYGDNQFK